MSSYPMFQEIINEMNARPEADPSTWPFDKLRMQLRTGPVGILEETISPLVDVCNKINDWVGTHGTWDFKNEPPWYEEFIYALTRYDIDLTPIWRQVETEGDSVAS